jgi:hypothetical protein
VPKATEALRRTPSTVFTGVHRVPETLELLGEL